MPDLDAVARDVFGWEELRPGQVEAMTAVLEGKDVLAVMPTGSGKSAIYQVPAALSEGLTVVVSPLISLQRDQVESLRGRLRAAQLNSSLTSTERDAVHTALTAGELDVLFLAPEQLGKEDVLLLLSQARPTLLVVDEAHCVCSWGHDFRPDYLRLGEAARRLGRPPLLALTATASPPVRAEITTRLAMAEPTLVVRGFDRPNLHLSVEQVRDDALRREAVVLRAMGEQKPGIIYTATRRSAERYAEALSSLGLDSAAYHAGLRASQREEVQERFMSGGLDVVVATTAFGMGIDKANVRFVLHAEVADSVDSYYQEIGRAGRDGQPALAVLFYRPEDVGLRRFFASNGTDEGALRTAVALVAHAEEPVAPGDLAKEMGISSTRVTSLVNLLEEAEALEVDERGSLVSQADPEQAARDAARIAAEHEVVERSRVEMLRGYAETMGCRRQYLLAYFGEQLLDPCGNCDRCEAGTATARPDGVDSPYELQSTVEHDEWGQGVVMQFDGDRITVLFTSAGYRTLSLEAVVSRGLLRHVAGPALEHGAAEGASPAGPARP